MGRRVFGNMYDRQRYSEMYESLIPLFNYGIILRGGWYLISLINVALKLLLQGGGEKVR